MNAGEEIGVVTDRGRQRDLTIRAPMQELRLQPFDCSAVLRVEEIAHGMSQRAPALAGERKQRVEHPAARGLCRLGGKPAEQAELERSREIKDVASDCDPSPRS